MSGEALKKKAKSLKFASGSKYKYIQNLIIRDFFDSPRTTAQLIDEVLEIYGTRLKTNEVQTYIRRFMPEVIRGIKVSGIKGKFWVLASVSREAALRLAMKDERVRKMEEDLFSEELMKKLRRDFSTEIEDLYYNFSKSGTCTAFLLRKILEKLIYLVFAKNGKESKLADRTRPGGLVGLETMINLSFLEKLCGVPFLTSRTANAIKGIKFLGDTAAHNPLVNVKMETIRPQMPFIIIAYEELAKRL